MTALLFGKLPAHGDFVARGVGQAQRQALDAWLSASQAAAVAAYPDFADRFDRALPWRAEGVGVAGAITPSQDAVGRRFPLLLLVVGDGDAGAHCEDLLFRAIGEGWDADRLAAEAGAAPDMPVVGWTGPDDTRLAGERPADLLTAMLA